MAATDTSDLSSFGGGRWAVLRTIERLDPEPDHQRIVHLSFGYFPRPLPLTRGLLRFSLKARGRAVRWFPPRRQPHFFTDDRNRTHPGGYRIGELGPTKLVEAEHRRHERRPGNEGGSTV